ncbi:MAG TPA: serine/threonine-protein kinase [Polyangiaceae bacterium]|nr:serine/threonine-protein kinase [Polyangiaceae bacterium]
MKGLIATANPEPPPVVSGQVLAGKFRIERVIGEGGMGIVAEATHLQLDERVALKFLRREVMEMPDVVARFDREARSAVKLKSEHVAKVTDVGKTEDGIPYMVMELLNGRDLAQTISESGPLPIQEAVDYLIQACEGVGEAHARGIVHRDLKPENLFVVQRDGWAVVKVLDFGISKAVLVGPSSVDLSSNNTTNIMGSPYYMSPEQLRSTRSVDHRADIWSLGVVLFELLTGLTIFDETKEFTELVADILETPHRKLCMFRPDAPLGLEAVIDKCLEKDRTKRFQNVAELAVALLPYGPRRARITAERTTSITRAAGLITDPNFQVPPSVYPPGPPQPLLGHSDSYPSAQQLTPPHVPRGLDPHAETVMPPHMPTPIQSSPSLPANALETTPQPRKQVSAVVLLSGAVLLLGCGVGLAYGVIRSLRPMPSVAAQPTVTAPAETQVGKTLPTTTTSTEATVVTSAETATATATHTATTRPRNTSTAVTARPPNTTTTTATATATATHPSLDIQLTR